VVVAAATVMAATSPSAASAPKTVSRRQQCPPAGRATHGAAAASGRAGVGGCHRRVHAALVQEHEPVRVHAARAYLGAPGTAGG
jgi:hypothetical protein